MLVVGFWDLMRWQFCGCYGGYCWCGGVFLLFVWVGFGFAFSCWFGLLVFGGLRLRLVV